MSKIKKEKKIFVLDTSVIIYEHNSILNFDEHDIGIPITVLEELDNFKKGNDTKNFEAREFIRLIDKLAKKPNASPMESHQRKGEREISRWSWILVATEQWMPTRSLTKRKLTIAF